MPLTGDNSAVVASIQITLPVQTTKNKTKATKTHMEPNTEIY